MPFIAEAIKSGVLTNCQLEFLEILDLLHNDKPKRGAYERVQALEYQLHRLLMSVVITDTSHGICNSVINQRRNTPVSCGPHAVEAWMGCLFEKWPKFSGNHVFPIGASQSYGKHQSEGTLWEGEQGELRRELLEFMKQQSK